MATQYFGFDQLVGSDPAGYVSINDLMDSIDTTLNTRFGSILNTANYSNLGVGDTDKVMFWDGSQFGLQKVDNDNVSASAAIAYSKLALSSSIQTGDFAAGATAPKATDLTGSTVGLVYQQGTDDTTAIANGTSGQILRLAGSPLVPTWQNVSALSIDTADLADDAVTAAKLRDSVSTDSDRAVTTNHIRDNAVTTSKIDITAASDPSGAAAGDMYYNTADKKVKFYNGSSWVEVSDLDSADGLSASGQTKLDNRGLVWINTTSFSSAATVDVDNVFSSAYKNYKLLINIDSATGLDLMFRWRDGGSTVNFNGSYGAYGSNATNVNTRGFFAQSLNSTGSGTRGIVEFFNIDPVNNCKPQYASQFYGYGVDYYFGYVVSNITPDGFQLIALQTGSPTITGNVSVYGYKT